MWISTTKYDLVREARSAEANELAFEHDRSTWLIKGLWVSQVKESWSGSRSEVVWSSNYFALERSITKDDSGSKTWEIHIEPQQTSNLLSESL